MKKILIVLAMLCLMAVGVIAGIETYTEDFSDCSEWNYIPNLNWTGSPTLAVNCSNGTLQCTDIFCNVTNDVVLTNNISFEGNYPVNITVDVYNYNSSNRLGANIYFFKDVSSATLNSFGWTTSEFFSTFTTSIYIADGSDAFGWYAICSRDFIYDEWYEISYVIDVENYNLTTYINGVAECSVHIPISLVGVDYFGLGTINEGKPTKEYDNLVVTTGSCVPDWGCSLYGDCNTTDLRPCIEATDNNTCGENYTGNYSEFTPQSCDYCTPSWSCSDLQGECPPSKIKECYAVVDANTCYAQTGLPSDDFTGSLGDYNEDCGYESNYLTGDVIDQVPDLLGHVGIELITLMGLLAIIGIVGLVGYKIERFGK